MTKDKIITCAYDENGNLIYDSTKNNSIPESWLTEAEKKDMQQSEYNEPNDAESQIISVCLIIFFICVIAYVIRLFVQDYKIEPDNKEVPEPDWVKEYKDKTDDSNNKWSELQKNYSDSKEQEPIDTNNKTQQPPQVIHIHHKQNGCLTFLLTIIAILVLVYLLVPLLAGGSALVILSQLFQQ